MFCPQFSHILFFNLNSWKENRLNIHATSLRQRRSGGGGSVRRRRGGGGRGWLDFKITRRRHNSVGPQCACPDRAPHWEIAVVVVAWLLSGAEVVPGDGEAVRDNKRYFYILVIKISFFLSVWLCWQLRDIRTETFLSLGIKSNSVVQFVLMCTKTLLFGKLILAEYSVFLAVLLLYCYI